MEHETITWRCDGHDLRIGITRAGAGPTLLLLPALSSISTRHELRGVQEQLAPSFSTAAVDWPGFGDQPKPYIHWRPAIYAAFLRHLLSQVVENPFGVVAAGHATGYVLRHFTQRETAGERLVFLSPTWRGPLPTMFGRDYRLFDSMSRGFDPPLLGTMLYGFNVNRAVIGMMARGHVYANRAWLSGPRLQEKLAVTRARGARHGSARFVTGCLDPFPNREEQIQAAQDIGLPILNVFSHRAPRKSRMEMEALAQVPNVVTVRMLYGKLSFYEEFPQQTADVVRNFLTGGPSVAAPTSPEQPQRSAAPWPRTPGATQLNPSRHTT
jgi:hypothetical protein